MKRAIGLLELKNITRGILSADAMLKAANVDMVMAQPLCPGKYVVMVAGDVGAVQSAIRSGKAVGGEENVVDEHILHMRKLLKTTLEDLDLSVRAYNCLKAAKINSLGEMVQYETHELLKFRNFGKKSLVEIEELLSTKGLHFGKDLAKYKLEED